MTPPPLGLRSRASTRLGAAATGLRAWEARQYLTAAVASLVTVLVVAIPTAMIGNPIFGREIPTTAWAWPALLVTAVLSGMLFATYVRRKDDRPEESTEGKAGALGGFLTFLAVGCPVCNKLALLALGYTGAIQWFAPVQPWLAVGAVALLGWALVRRLAAADACPVPVRAGEQG
ncbi:hypothetical protein OEB99_10730 [Actinotalea sp. M2MS4P-6]|uniref:hypothetical protein n=1 Tax=Actinotalea sp. M2MS4P-6 TaxID=2983762 RepID=UPI0021E4848F|nr:hypothetical protein [Actinotalea sp. M2MS4P-6]MCV2394783.1 hypothetical protein [Actinotalea sp. M2MS4P-6]